MSEAEEDVTLDVPEIHFPGGLPGFPGHERYALVSWGGEGSPFAMLRSLDDPQGATFVVVPPNVFFSDYSPEIADDLANDLSLEAAEDALLLTIVTVGSPVSQSTVNLLGPIVINVHTSIGAQAVLDPDKFSAATPIQSN